MPTPLPVDTLATFDELAEPLRALLPVHDGALQLAAANGETVGERQVRRWVDDLAEIGLLDAGSYEPRAGVPYEPADESALTRAYRSYVVTEVSKWRYSAASASICGKPTRSAGLDGTWWWLARSNGG